MAPDTVEGGRVPDDRPWWHHGTALWPMALSSLGIVVARLLDDPYDAFGGPVLHFIVLGGSGALFATTVVLLVARRRIRRAGETPGASRAPGSR